MFLTTESGLPERKYNRVRVISGVARVIERPAIGRDWREAAVEAAIENALGNLYNKALQLQIDGVIGIQIGVCEGEVITIGTAIAFLDERRWLPGQGDDLVLL